MARASRLASVMAGLEASLREVLVRRDVLGEPSGDVARALGIGLEAMKSRLHRARGEVRQRLLRELSLSSQRRGASSV